MYSKKFYILTNLFDNSPIICEYTKIHKKGDDSIEIKIIGSNCSTGKRLKKMINTISKNNHLDVEIQELNQGIDKKNYNVSMIPALVINEKIISQGKILSDKEIKKLIVNSVTN